MSKRLTKEEREAVAALKSVAKIWPDSLWLFSAGGGLHVMRKGPNGQRMTERSSRSGGMDQGYSVAKIDIENDGGDW